MLATNKIPAPDLLAESFILLTDDLSYARTFYPSSDIVKYLNELAFRAHLLIYKNKKEKKGRLKSFWMYEFPLLFRQQQKFFFYSFIIFFVSVCIGVVSTLFDDTFVRLILGDSYVNMTLQNMQNGDPLAVYKQMNQMDMFLGITLNNIYVSFLAFIMGALLSVGTAYVLFNNGVMLGAFFTFFYQHGIFTEAMTTVWIHGTLEIFAIIVAGATGLMLGNSILFPGTYTRLTSFKKGTSRGIRIVAGLIPVFIIAGFFEGFITRYTQMPYAIRSIFIILSLIGIIWFFFIYPARLKNQIMK